MLVDVVMYPLHTGNLFENWWIYMCHFTWFGPRRPHPWLISKRGDFLRWLDIQTLVVPGGRPAEPEEERIAGLKVGVVLLVAIYIYMPNITITKILWEEGFFHIPLQFLKTEVNLQAYCIFGFLISKLQLALELGSADWRGQEWQEISKKETRNNMQVSAARSSQPCPTVSMKLLLPGPPTMKATNSNTKQPMTSGYDTSNRSKQRT